jgi:poly(hydroxyalkanoate) granule-associated protein
MPARKKKTTLRQSVRKTRAAVRDAFEAAQQSVQDRVEAARDQAEETWDSLESLFQSRVQKAMTQLGVPGGDEFRQLAQRVTEMRKELTALSRASGGRKKAAARRKPAARRR